MGIGRDKIAVTGGLGFIGTHLVDSLVRTGHEVAVLDSAAPTTEQARLDVELVRVDLGHGDEVHRVMSRLAEAGYRSLIHLAGNSDALLSTTRPDFDFTANAAATANVLTSAARTGWQRAVIASSALIYGRSGARFRPETELPDPIFPYSASKLAAEAYATALSRWSDLQVVSARLFTVYGPSRDPENSPVEPIQYVARAAQDRPITVLGDPAKKVRDFVHVDDVVDALRIILDKGRPGHAYNVGTGVATSLESLLDQISDQLGRPVKWQADRSDLSDSYRIVADIDRICGLGFSPGMSLRDALAATLSSRQPSAQQPSAQQLSVQRDTIEVPVTPRPSTAAAMVRTQPLRTEDHHLLREVLRPITNDRAALLETMQVSNVLSGVHAEMVGYRPATVDRVAVYLPSNVVAYSYALFAIVPSLFARRVDLRAARIVHEQTERVHQILSRYAAAEVSLCAMSQSEYRHHTQDADVVIFTGSFDNGLEVARQYPDALFLFFGSGVNPLVVGEAADVELAVDIAIESRMYNSGQDCLCPDALLVHARHAERFVERLVHRVTRLRLGDPDDPHADYSPLYYPGVAGHVRRLLAGRKDQVVHRGVVSERTHVVDPAVLVCDLNAPYQVHENFAPVFDVRIYQDDDQIEPWLSAPSRRELALGATVIGADVVADRLARRHWVARDRSLFDADDGNQPFGGYGMKASHLRFQGQVSARPLLVSREVATVLGRKS